MRGPRDPRWRVLWIVVAVVFVGAACVKTHTRSQIEALTAELEAAQTQVNATQIELAEAEAVAAACRLAVEGLATSGELVSRGAREYAKAAAAPTEARIAFMRSGLDYVKEARIELRGVREDSRICNGRAPGSGSG